MRSCATGDCVGLGLERQLACMVLGCPGKLWCGFSAFLIRDCGFLALASVLLQEQVYYLAVFLCLTLWNMEDTWGTRFSCGAGWCVNGV